MASAPLVPASPQAAPAADSVRWRGPFLAEPPPLASPAPPSPVLVQLGLARVPLLFEVALEPAPGIGSPWFRSPLLRLPGPPPSSPLRPGAVLATRIARPAAEEAAEEPGPVQFLPELPVAPEAALPPRAGPVEFADLDVRIRGRGEFGGDWTRFRPCDAGIQLGCQPGLLPRLVPELQFGVQMGGTISDRIVVNVDYDQTREFSATNNINVFYRGVEDEILQRVEVGDVTFGLPESRFLTEGIPAGNFGLRATGQLGPVDFETVFAQQKGDLSSREFRLAGAGTDRAFVQEDTLVVDNADYVRGQFFFLADPRNLFDYPHIDILAADPSTVPSSAIPGAEPIQLYRFESDPVTRQQVEGYIQADASATLGDHTVTESGWFRYLQPGVDFFVHPSGLWIALRSPLRRDEMLAVTYITAAGDTIGDYNPERIHNEGGRPRLSLLRASQPNHQPGRPTWDLEMHQVYRVSGSNDVEIPSVSLEISVGELSAGRTFTRGLAGEDITYLKLLGLDEESPADVLDRAYVYKPAADAFEDRPPVSGTFIVFPTLKPFAQPPPVPSLGLSYDQTSEILAGDANPEIYDAVDPFERENSGLYWLTIPFRVRSEGIVSSFSLGALGIRDGSERLAFGDRVLEATTDYIIDYDMGQVTLLDAENLFATDPAADLRATWEQQALFQIAPTSVFGMNASYALGEVGEVNFLGLYQREKALMRRPQLGVEPASILLGGLNGRMEMDLPALDRALDRVPGLNHSGVSRLRVAGEMALSLPSPNTAGDVYLHDFDSSNDLPLSSLNTSWRLGSAPQFRDGALQALPPALGSSDIASLEWQHTWITEGASGDSTGVFEGYLPRNNIDRQINVAGNEIREPGLLITFGIEESGAGGRFDRRRWRSITTNLSGSGLDLTRTEFLDLYIAGGEALTFVFDLGTVSEDALFVDETGLANGSREDGAAWGLGTLDQEADPRKGEIWNDELDQRGLWGETCRATRAVAYRIGDARVNCTRGNGRRDTEDLDGDGNLDTDERYMRYVVELDGSSPYLVRDTIGTGTLFRLYRIPLRGPHGVNPGGMFTDGDFRAIKQLRLSVAGNAEGAAVLARMRLVGSRWVKRAGEGVVSGVVGDDPGTGGTVEVSPVSAVEVGAAYQPPPGVVEQLDDPTTALGAQGVEFNEKALGIRYRGLPPGERAEVYHRFPQRPRNFLTYRQARIWALARNGDWGMERPSYFYLKVGSDADNFYLYRTRLEPAVDPNGVRSDDWLPEILVDFDRWLELRSEAEQRLIDDPPPAGAPALVVWSADSTYAVALQDRARAPNLSQVRELSLGVWNQGEFTDDGEVWVNEFRLSNAVTDRGLASHLNVDLNASDFMTTRISVSDRGALFRQLEGDPNYQRDQQWTANSTMQLSRFTPASWGIELPLTVSHTSSGQDPTFLLRSDIRADRLERLRKVAFDRTRVGVSFRKRTPSTNPLLAIFLDGLNARAGYSSAESTTATSESGSHVLDARVGYDRAVEPRTLPVVPGFLGGIVRLLLPESLEERVLASRLRWSPERIGFGASYANQRNQTLRFQQILRLPGDSSATRTSSPRRGMDTDGRVIFRPFQSVTATTDFTSSRDLLSPELAVRDPAVRPLLARERSYLAGMDLGWETNRRLRTNMRWAPRPADWLQWTVTWTTNYNEDRNATLVQRRIAGADTLRELQRNVGGQRSASASLTFDAGMLARGGPRRPGIADGPSQGMMRTLAGALAPWVVNWQDGIISRFNREVLDPDIWYQFGLNDLEGFRVVDGATAATLVDRNGWAWGSGLTLLPGITIDADYSVTDIATFDTRSDRASHTRSWPNLVLRAGSVPLPSFVRPVVERLTLNSGYRFDTRRISFGRGTQQQRLQEDATIPLDVSVRWGGGFATSYRTTRTRGEGTDPTGDTRRRRTTHVFTMSGSFVPPGNFGERLTRPVQASVRYNRAAQSDCRITSGNDECVPFVDQYNSTFNLTLDTVVSDLQVGFQASYNDRQSSIGQRLGSTQLQVGFWGQFIYNAGAFAGLP